MFKAIKKIMSVFLVCITIGFFSGCDALSFGGLKKNGTGNVKGSTVNTEEEWCEAFNNAAVKMPDEGFAYENENTGRGGIDKVICSGIKGNEIALISFEEEGEEWQYLLRENGKVFRVMEEEGKLYKVEEDYFNWLEWSCESYQEGADAFLWKTYEVAKYSEWQYDSQEEIYSYTNIKNNSSQYNYKIKIVDGAVQCITLEVITDTKTEVEELTIGGIDIEVPEYEKLNG